MAILISDSFKIRESTSDEWEDILFSINSPGVPPGGTAGQMLTKTGPSDYATAWHTLNGGGPNLLDNWYFVGGGSQLGYGVFPINQRGQTVYTGEGYCIDRWRANGSFTLASDGISIGSDVVLCQRISNINALVGKQLSFSVLTANELITASFVFSIQTINYAVTDDFAIGYITSLGGFTIYARNANAIKILSAKLEIGSTQTLAHQENGVWVLNEIPDYGEELANCQRYYYRLVEDAYGTYAIGFIADDNNRASFIIQHPVPMATVPTPNYIGSFGINTTQFGDATHYYTRGNNMKANLTFTANYNVPRGTVAALQDRGNGNTVIEFSADL